MKKLWQFLGVLAFWCVWPALWLYLRGTRRTRVLIVCGDEFLALRGWLGAGNWTLPGGGLHKGEEPLAGLLREVSEETGLMFAKKQVTFLYAGKYHEYGLGFSYDCYVVQLPQKPAVFPRRWEIVAYAWLPVVNPKFPLAQDVRAALEKWLSER